jgi:hypothetical protein
MSEKGEPHGYNFNVTNFNVILKHNVTEPWIQQTSFTPEVCGTPEEQLQPRLTALPSTSVQPQWLKHMPQNWMANQQFYILVV